MSERVFIEISIPEYKTLSRIKRAEDTIRSYTVEGCYVLNAYLRNSKRERNEKIEEMIRKLDAIFEFSERSDGYKKVYRGIPYQIPNSGEFQSAYTSTSTSMEEANNFRGVKDGCCLLIITLEKGMEYVDISSYSEHEHEKEILLPRNIYLIPTKHEGSITHVIATRYPPPPKVDKTPSDKKSAEDIFNLIDESEKEFIESLDDLKILFPDESSEILEEVFLMLL